MKIPNNPQCEAAVLGSVLLDPDTLHDIAAILGPKGECFHDRRNAALYDAMMAIHARGATPDTATLGAEMEKGTGGADLGYLSTLIDSDVTVTSARAGQYAQTVRDTHTRRRVMDECRMLATRASEGADPVQDILTGVNALFNELSAAHVHDDPVPISACVPEALEHFRTLTEADGALTGIPAGMPPLDKLTGGWQPGTLNIIAARPSVGKSAFALNIALHAAKEGVPVLFFSLEMARAQLAQRLLCMTGGTRADLFTSGFLARKALGEVQAAAPVLSGLPLYVDDSPMCTLWEVGSKARKAQRKHGRGLIIVDYLQLLRTGQRHEARYLEVAEISASLKALAREQGCPVIALCQLGRSAEAESNAQKLLAHLRESGSIEQDADTVTILSRLSEKQIKEHEEKHGPGKYGSILPTYLAKNRNGPTGAAFLQYDKLTQVIGPLRDLRCPDPDTLAAGTPDFDPEEYEDDDGVF